VRGYFSGLNSCRNHSRLTKKIPSLRIRRVYGLCLYVTLIYPGVEPPSGGAIRTPPASGVADNSKDSTLRM